MTTLYDNNFEQKINSKINAKIARVGGAVFEILTYDRVSSVSDFNLLDEAFGTWSFFAAKSGVKKMYRYLRRLAKQELMFWLKGWVVVRDRKSLAIDGHELAKQGDLLTSFDACVSSNLLEHSTNPIKMLLNMSAIVKEGGWHYHVLPFYKYTYDSFRSVTPVEHMINDFEVNQGNDDQTHIADYVTNAYNNSEWLRNLHKDKEMSIAFPYLHQHVFDEHNVKQLFELIFTEVFVDVHVETKSLIVLAKNTLQPAFKSKYEKYINEYVYEKY
jgi:hypothetical protein